MNIYKYSWYLTIEFFIHSSFIIYFRRYRPTHFFDCLQAGFHSSDMKIGQMESWIISRGIELRYECSELCVKHIIMIFFCFTFGHCSIIRYEQEKTRHSDSDFSSMEYIARLLHSQVLVVTSLLIWSVFVSYSAVIWVWRYGNPYHFFHK